MKYRPEIDGLRTIAVLPVILFHAGFEVFRGGFVGVDIFFVISGYLITTILLGELERDDLSILRFYERRARRILPALFVVIAATLPFAWFWLTPSTFADYGASIIATVFFASNILFWRSQGYFANDAELTPLLHTWSLAVEEQYYLFFPLFLLLVWRFGRQQVLWLIIALAALSLVASEIGWRHAPTANFYLIPTRAWELLAGSICAFLSLGRAQRSSQGLSLLGLVLILAAIFGFDHSTPMPSLWAAIPVLGTVLLILYAAPGTWVAWALSRPLFVGIGLISYSAYLWHQPLFAFARIRVAVEPHPLLMGGLALMSLALAYLTWRYIEQPFRRRPVPVLASQAAVFKASLAAGLVFTMIGAAVLRLPTHLELTRPELFVSTQVDGPEARPCPGFDEIAVGTAQCSLRGTGAEHVVVWGDSHAEALADGIDAVSAEQTVMVLFHHGCPPALGTRRVDGLGTARNCDSIETMPRYRDYIAAFEPAQVILVGRWTIYQQGWYRHGKLEEATHFLTREAGAVALLDAAQSTAALEAGLRATIDGFADLPVTVLGQPAELNFLTDYDRIRRTELARDGVAAWHAPETEMLERLDGLDGVVTLSLRDIMCSDVACPLRRDGLALYSDDNHLSPAAAQGYWPLILAHQ